MSATSQFPIYDALYGGTLCATMLAWKGDGLSFDQIAAKITEEQGHGPGRETVRRWMGGDCQ